jgi:phosphoglycerate kinase
MKFLKNLKKKDLSGKTCLLRVDFNIGDDELKKIKGKKNIPLRIERILPTMNFLLKNGARIIILSHRGRPEAGKIDSKFSLKPFAKILSGLLNEPVKFVGFSEEVNGALKEKIILLENLRFLPGEEENDKKLGKKLASLGSIFINDAFSVSHRANASVEAITRFIPSYAGLSLEEELKNLNSVMKNPAKPFVFVLGGAKISDKIGIINNFMKKADKFIIGGGMANTFFAAEGMPMGDSLYEKNKMDVALKLLKSSKIVLPSDANMEKGKILDIGARAIEEYSEIIKKAKTVVWNGPMGYIEALKFRKGSEAIAEAIMNSSAKAVVGGGETISMLKAKKTKKLKASLFVSTGGGAMLEYLAGKKLPGIAALNK